ncbi:MAG: hypothetical protein LBP39_03370 [Rickettsiales bacterium]|jgi:hypothetical protein|nr:hypothetical protein [Rickettsiales bacterium]
MEDTAYVYDGLYEDCPKPEDLNGLAKVEYKNGTVFDGKFNNGRFLKGEITCYDGKTIECEWENIQLPEGNNLDYFVSYILENKPSKNGQTPKTRVILGNGNVFDGELENGEFSSGVLRYANGNIYDGEFQYDKPSDGVMRFNGGYVCEGKWKDGKPLDISIKAPLSNTGKSYCLYRIGTNNSLSEVRYCLEDEIYGTTKIMTIDYVAINNILNGKDGEINNLDDLIKRRVIKGVGNFDELKEFAKKVLRDKMSGGVKEGFDSGGHIPLEDLLLLSSVDTVEQLKKTRFQLHYTREAEDSLKKDYGSLKNLLESVGIYNINEVEEDYISLRLETIPIIHAISVILDIKKMKDLMKETGKKDLDEAVASEKVIHCFDSSRILGCYIVKVNDSLVRYNMGALHKNCDFVNLAQQKLDSCWFHAVAATLTAMKHPELVQKIRDGEIELYDIEHCALENNDKLNEFQLKQMNTIIEMSEKFNIGSTWYGRKSIDMLIRDLVKKRVEDAPIPNMTEGVLGTKIVNKIREMESAKLKIIAPEQPVKTNSETDSVIKKGKLGFFHRIRLWFRNVAGKLGKSDFYHKIRLINKQYEKINRYREILENSRKVIEKRLEAEKPLMLYGKKTTDDSLLVGIKSSSGEEIQVARKSLDDSDKPRDGSLPFFIGREKARKNSEIRQKNNF